MSKVSNDTNGFFVYQIDSVPYFDIEVFTVSFVFCEAEYVVDLCFIIVNSPSTQSNKIFNFNTIIVNFNEHESLIILR